jgi:predicted acetyltransferase
MVCGMIKLIPPTAALHSSWLESLDEWGGAHQDGSGDRGARMAGLDLRSPEDFGAWVDLMHAGERPGPHLPEGSVPSTVRWAVENDEYLGTIDLRHTLGNRALDELFGHIGYSVRPSARKRGVAAFMLQSILETAMHLGLERVLLTCEDSNEASWRTIEAAGGVLESVRQPDDFARELGYSTPMRRYWITL